MTRWSLRRRLGMARGDEREHERNAAPPVDQPPVGHASPGQASSRWFDSGGQHETGSPVALLAGPPQSPYGGPAAPEWDVPPVPGQLGQPGQADAAQVQAGEAWPDICDQFGLHLLVLAEQLRSALDELEADEGDPERLHRLYQVDHAVTRMRRASRDLRTLAGRSEEELAGFTTSLLDVIRMAASAIERYTQVSIGRVTDLAVLGYAADDVGALLSALLDNATRYSPGAVTVSGHLLEDGGVMFRVEDTGIGIGMDQVAVLNTAFAGPVPDVDEHTGRHTGFPVVHRIARKHSIAVRLASRPLPSSGTVAMVMLPPHLLCEVPEEETRSSPVGTTSRGVSEPAGRSQEPALSRRERLGSAAEPQRSAAPRTAELPRREPASLRGDDPRPAPTAVPLSPRQQEAARRAFADELSAFSAGSTGPLGTVGGTSRAGTATDEATEEGGQP